MTIAGQEKKILDNLNQFVLKAEAKTKASLLKAYLYIQNKAIKITPKDTGNLRNSYYNKLLIYKNSLGIEIGNKSNYAIYTHENLQLNFKVGEAKYLQKTLVNNVEKIKSIITNEVKI